MGEDVVGVTKFSTYPPEAKKKTSVGTFWQPDIEEIFSLQSEIAQMIASEIQAVITPRNNFV